MPLPPTLILSHLLILSLPWWWHNSGSCHAAGAPSHICWGPYHYAGRVRALHCLPTFTGFVPHQFSEHLPLPHPPFALKNLVVIGLPAFYFWHFFPVAPATPVLAVETFCAQPPPLAPRVTPRRQRRGAFADRAAGARHYHADATPTRTRDSRLVRFGCKLRALPYLHCLCTRRRAEQARDKYRLIVMPGSDRL